MTNNFWSVGGEKCHTLFCVFAEKISPKLITVGFVLKKMACFVKLSLARRVIGSAIVANIKIFVTKALFAISVASKLLALLYAESG